MTGEGWNQGERCLRILGPSPTRSGSRYYVPPGRQEFGVGHGNAGRRVQPEPEQNQIAEPRHYFTPGRSPPLPPRNPNDTSSLPVLADQAEESQGPEETGGTDGPPVHHDADTEFQTPPPTDAASPR